MDISRTAYRFPVAESLFQDSLIQPYIHNREVSVLDGQHIHHFRIFFKRHCYLPSDPLLSNGDQVFRGDVVVMKVRAGLQQEVINMRSWDSALADYMIVL